MSSPGKIADGLVAASSGVLEQLASRHAPGLALPAWFAGHPVGDDARADLAWALRGLAELGVGQVAGRGLDAILADALAAMEGESPSPFAAFRTSEVLLALGARMDPLRRSLGPAAWARVERLTDTSAILDADRAGLGGRPRNYWFVLLRAERARAALGLPTDPSVGELALARCRGMLEEAQCGFIDDALDGSGRHDSYSADMLVFAEPLADALGREAWRKAIAYHAGWLARSCLLDGTAFAWGRSTGPLAKLLALELAALALREGVGPAGALAAIARRVADDLAEGFPRGLTDAHQRRRQDGYRGPSRRLQMTLDLLGKAIEAARWLRQVTPERARRVPGRLPALDGDRDEWTSFDARGHGCWAHRSRWWSFQLPCVAVAHADYAPFPCAPGQLEPPADSPLRPGVPRVRIDGREYTVVTGPSSVQRSPGAVRLGYASLGATGKQPKPPARPLPGETRVAVEGRDLVVEQSWDLPPGCPPAQWGFVASGRSFRTRIDHAPEGTRLREVDVSGIAEYAGRWAEGTRLHELELPVPASGRLAFRVRVRPVQRVMVAPAQHQYVRSLYDALGRDDVEEIGLDQGRPFGDTAFEEGLRRADVFHLHWPEYLVGGGGMPPEEYRRAMLALVKRIGESPVKVVWTLHNRRPHYQGDNDWTTRLWQAWAEVADAVVHHSRWGEEQMRAELPFRPGTIHRVIPHGHFGEIDRERPTRAQAEAALGLPPCRVRLGIVGRPQKEKRVDMIARAFVAGAPADWQLLVAAVDEHLSLPDDPRVRRLSRPSSIPRADIARQVAACDALVAVVGGPTYLTSGQHADAVGHGIPMIVDRWPFWRETLGDAALVFGDTEADLASFLARLSPEAIAAGAEAARALRGPLGWDNLARPFAGLLDELGLARRL